MRKKFQIFVFWGLALCCLAGFGFARENSGNIDVDLSAMSGTMVYSMVYRMVSSPEEFIGKRIKMKGVFASYLDEDINRRFFGCVIQDALACCSQGLAFELESPRKYPKEFPKEGSPITLVGTFAYESDEDGFAFPIIKKAKIIK